uniref:N-acetyltransferase domain-containing protein n=1 Tax=viral metagenome TaxID=1070528 RepID=A0A6C0I2B8_9ZZZZ
MNFYSEDIVNDIIDHSPLEEIVEKLDDFNATSRYIFLRYVGLSVGPEYTDAMVSNEQNKMAFHCIDSEFEITNCPSVMIYRRFPRKNEIVYYILLICTKSKFKGMGYASKLLDGFIERVKQETKKYGNTKKITIALSSVETAVTFYEEYGFKWTRKTLKDHTPLTWFEAYDDAKEYFIMELDIIQ